jgi:hypothetical protein
VFDYIFKGLSQPLIGTFVIPIGELMVKLREKKTNRVLKATKIIRALADKLNSQDDELDQIAMRKKKKMEEI